MLPLTVRRAFVPLCLTLGVLLSARPALADTPTKPTVQASTAQTIVLQHVVPDDIVKMMHWEQPSICRRRLADRACAAPKRASCYGDAYWSGSSPRDRQTCGH